MSIGMPGRPALVIVLLVAAAIVAGACSRGERQASGAIALINDPVALDSALARCNQRSASVEDPECRNVRLALVRLAQERREKNGDDEIRKQREAQIKFEQQREALRRRLDREREQQKQAAPVDPYTMPFVPPQSPDTPKSESNAQPRAQLGNSEPAASTHVASSGPGLPNQ